MIQVVLIIAVLVIFILYFKTRGDVKVKVPRDELAVRCDFYQEQVMNFLRQLKQSQSKTMILRLENEIERMQKFMDLDEFLEKAEKESNPNRAIDFYLEALSYTMRNNFEQERKIDIENSIKNLQELSGKRVLRR